MNILYKNHSAFTIVELLVVIVVIGILAAITIVSYTGVSQKATASSLKSDLSNGSKKLKMYQVEYGSYPTMGAPDSNGMICPTSPIDTKYCIKPSTGNTFAYFPVNGTNFTLIATNTASTTKYNITDNSAPILGSSNWISGIAATALANKWVYNVDISGDKSYKTSVTTLTSPQGVTGIDPNYPLHMALVNPQTNPNVDFSAYPAQNACKAIGGRLPNMQEIAAIYSSKASYGNNFQANVYWSSTEYNIGGSGAAYGYDLWSNTVYFASKTDTLFVRCVSG